MRDVNYLGAGKVAWLWGRCVVLAVFWVVLMERNKRIFADASCQELDQQLSVTVCFWASAFSTFRDYSFQVILYNWNAAVT